MATKIDVCNFALSLIGSDTVSTLDIDNITDSSSKKSIRLCNQFYDLARDEILTRYRWKRAIKWQALTQSTSTNLSTWDYIYNLPSDYLRILNMKYKDQEFSIEGDYLYTNYTTATVKYIFRVLNLGNLDPFCIKAISYRLASELAVAMIGEAGAGLKQQLENHIETYIIPEGKASNALQTIEADYLRQYPGEWVMAREGTTPFRGLKMIAPPTNA